MTEAEWLGADTVPAVLKPLKWRVDGRKIRLLVCAWCKHRWGVLDEKYRIAVKIAERFAEGEATGDELRDAREIARSASEKVYGVSAAYAATIQRTAVRSAAAHMAYIPYEPIDESREPERRQEIVSQIEFARDIFGNPFRPVAFDPRWRTEHAVGLALRMYDERNFDAMPILADALEEAGCDNPDILLHCREPGAHVRGCWVVDLVLGKA